MPRIDFTLNVQMPLTPLVGWRALRRDFGAPVLG